MAAVDFLLRGKDLNDQMVGPASAWVSEMPQYARRLEKTVSGTVTTIYRAWALYGTAEGANAWMVQRIQITKSGTTVDLTDGLAGGDAHQFAFSWTGRAGHTYT